jgi:hypothetical protein
LDNVEPTCNYPQARSSEPVATFAGFGSSIPKSVPSQSGSGGFGTHTLYNQPKLSSEPSKLLGSSGLSGTVNSNNFFSAPNNSYYIGKGPRGPFYGIPEKSRTRHQTILDRRLTLSWDSESEPETIETTARNKVLGDIENNTSRTVTNKQQFSGTRDIL